MIKRHLPQVKTFKIVNYIVNGGSADKAVNEFVAEIFNRTGNSPVIHPCGDYIMVTWQELIEIKGPKIPQRTFANVETSKDTLIP